MEAAKSIPRPIFIPEINEEDCEQLLERSNSAAAAGTSSMRVDEGRLSLKSRPSSWIIVPPKWAQMTVGCDFCTLRNTPRFALLVILLTMLIFASQTLTPGKVEILLHWLQENSLRGSIFFVVPLSPLGCFLEDASPAISSSRGSTQPKRLAQVLLAGAHLVAFPCVLLFLVAGAVFGLVLGAVLVWIGTTIGQTLAFCVGRYMLKAWVSELMNRYFPRWAAIDCAISKEGWKLITLLRLSPIIPWNVLNYALSVTGVPFLSFALPSAVSIIPWCTTTVYFGSLARDIADIFDGQVPLKGSASYIFYALSGITMVLVVAYTTLVSRRAIREAVVTSNAGGQEIVEELDALALMAGSPGSGGQLQNPLSPSSTGGWSRPFGWSGAPPPDGPTSPTYERRTSCFPSRRPAAVELNAL